MSADRRAPAASDGKCLCGLPSRASQAGTLASRRGTWQGSTMADTPPSAAGGILIALCSIGGTAIGLMQGQVTIGFLAGLAIGAAGAVAIWLRDRRR